MSEDDIIAKGPATRLYKNRVYELPEFEIIKSGHEIESNDGYWLVRTDSGHSPEHISLLDKKRKLYLSGDFLLPRISPNISDNFFDPFGDPFDNFFDRNNEEFYEVEADALLYNTKIDVSQNPTRRRLRSVKYRYELPRLNAGDEIVGTTSGFRVLAPSKEVSDEALPAAPADAPVSESGKADSTSSGEADVDTWLIVVIVVCVVAIAGVLVLVNKDKMCPAGSSGGSAAPASAEEGASLLVGNRKTRFSNLRY